TTSLTFVYKDSTNFRDAYTIAERDRDLPCVLVDSQVQHDSSSPVGQQTVTYFTLPDRRTVFSHPRPSFIETIAGCADCLAPGGRRDRRAERWFENTGTRGATLSNQRCFRVVPARASVARRDGPLGAG